MNTCTWRQESPIDYSDHWIAECGLDWSMPEGKPSDHRMRFCPGCGKPLVEAPAGDDE